MNRFLASYYKGPRGIFQEVEIEILNDQIIIYQGTETVTHWKISEVKSHTDNDDSKVYLSYEETEVVTHLEVIGQDFWQYLKASTPEKFVSKPKSKYVGLYKLTGVFIILILGFWWFYNSILPGLVDKTAGAIPYTWEQKLGKSLFSQLKTQEKIDESKSALIDSFFHELQWDSAFPSKIHYSESDVVNAFAMPGGNIVVYSGLLNKMESYSELVALLGHEYGHIEKRHVLRGMVQSVSTFAAVSLILGDLTAVSAVFLEQANKIYNLKFSRAYETESDEFSFQKMKENSIDPQGIISLFERLKDSSDSSTVGSSIPDFLSTHPGVENRIKVMEKRIKSEPFAIIKSERLEVMFKRLKDW